MFTGFKDLDGLTGGFSAGDLVFLSGRTATGKTALALNIALYEARHYGAAGVFSLETNKNRMFQRLMSAVTSVAIEDIAKRNLEPSDWRSLLRGTQGLIRSNLHVSCPASISVRDIAEQTRQISIERLRIGQRPLSFVVVDYLQLMLPFGQDSEQRERSIAQILHGLKVTAQNLGACIMLIGQLDRESKGMYKGNSQPTLSDLKEQHTIERYADTVLLLHREDSDDITSDEKSPTEVIVAAQQFGQTGTVQLDWLNDLRGFRTMAHRPALGED